MKRSIEEIRKVEREILATRDRQFRQSATGRPGYHAEYAHEYSAEYALDYRDEHYLLYRDEFALGYKDEHELLYRDEYALGYRDEHDLDYTEYALDRDDGSQSRTDPIVRIEIGPGDHVSVKGDLDRVQPLSISLGGGRVVIEKIKRETGPGEKP